MRKKKNTEPKRLRATIVDTKPSDFPGVEELLIVIFETALRKNWSPTVFLFLTSRIISGMFEFKVFANIARINGESVLSPFCAFMGSLFATVANNEILKQSKATTDDDVKAMTQRIADSMKTVVTKARHDDESDATEFN